MSSSLPLIAENFIFSCSFLSIIKKNFFVFVCFFGCATCGILVPQPGIEPVAPAVEGQEAWSHDQQTTREFPPFLFYEVRVCGGGCRGGRDGRCEDRSTAFLWSGSPTGRDLTPMVPHNLFSGGGRGCPVAESPLSQPRRPPGCMLLKMGFVGL